MNRKEFIKTVGTACLATGSISVLLESCGSIYYANHTLANNVIVFSHLEFMDTHGERPFIIIKEATLPFPICVYKSGEQLTALFMQCTHQGCEVNPNAYSLVCPCHGSEFDTAGKVLNPPAEEPLISYQVTQDDKNYYIHLTKS